LFAAVLLLSLLTFELTLLFMALIIVVFVITGVLSIIEYTMNTMTQQSNNNAKI